MAPRMTTNKELPVHLKKYIVEQNYEGYTPEDQAVWRFILRQLKKYLSEHAHPCYADGLVKTGITLDKIPHIEDISEKLSHFGWKAIPVSGFIPPAAFMEFQSRGYLPIASDMRTVGHILYTPAPDIVHEAAGHAPILIDPDFSYYLQQYAQVASNAIIGHEDLLQYDLIRKLSDLKESSKSSSDAIKIIEDKLNNLNQNMNFISEAAYLSRMNWWTAEYGLFGDIKNPKIFGAGLLSSIGEAKNCLSDFVKKIPLTIDCINYSYDITNQQPQLFVTENFSNLTLTLEQLASKMSFKLGGIFGLNKAIEAKTVNTVELDSGLQISGILDSFISSDQEVQYIKFSSPTQLSINNHQIEGHSKSYHSHGYSTALGPIENLNKCLSNSSQSELKRVGVEQGSSFKLNFKSGIILSGIIDTLHFDNNRLVIAKVSNAKMTKGEELLFDPNWGTFDLGIGSKVTSVFGGAADRVEYGDFDEDFKVRKVPEKQVTPQKKQEFDFFEKIKTNTLHNAPEKEISKLVQEYVHSPSTNWLITTELINLTSNQTSLAIEKAALLAKLEACTTTLDEKQCIEMALS